ncbi:MAG: hypothetical protein H0U65_07770 [Rubrobacter sp.]|jgi:hypothetical protein|nr:hypothetical protein [Rubrobacter sp.]
MERTLTLEVPEEVFESLRRKAEEAGKPPEALAIEYLAAATENRGGDPVEEFIGAFDSKVPEWADRHDEHIGCGSRQ